VHRFVATDSTGTQHLPDHRRAWPLPSPGGEPGGVSRVRPGEHPIVLLDIDGLLDVLGDRIFLAEEVEGGARLLRELPWDLACTATFALDCAEHVLSVLPSDDGAELALSDGTTLGELLAEARSYVSSAGRSDDRRLSALSRLALARRVGKEQQRVAALAMAAVTDDEHHGVYVLDDPRWVNLAALSSALLACVEVLRHVALPRYVAARERAFVVEGDAPPDTGETWVTPWGPVARVSGHVPTYVPAYVSAREAAERARQAVTDVAGAEAGAREREFQRARLLELLGLAGAE
jgi:hypothetical protein